MRTQAKRAHRGSICGGLRYSVSVCAALLIMIATAISVESSIATARSGIDTSVEFVDRARKGDRLPLVQARIDVPRARASGATLPDGCDSVVSLLTRSDLVRVAQSCDS